MPAEPAEPTPMIVEPHVLSFLLGDEGTVHRWKVEKCPGIAGGCLVYEEEGLLMKSCGLDDWLGNLWGEMVDGHDLEIRIEARHRWDGDYPVFDVIAVVTEEGT